jgi:hypothetical protein
MVCNLSALIRVNETTQRVSDAREHVFAPAVARALLEWVTIGGPLMVQIVVYR